MTSPTAVTRESLGTVLPFYFVADESASMADNIDTINDALDEMLATLHTQSFAASKVRFSIHGFSDDARVYLQPTDLRQVDALPALTAHGRTHYSAAFDLLAAQIPHDVAGLKASGYSVTRPAVYFLTDGQPLDDDWREARARLLAIRERPNLLAFGIGDVDADTIREVATEHAFIQSAAGDFGDTLVEFFGSLTQSIINSGSAIAAGENKLEIEKPKNFISLDMDVL